MGIGTSILLIAAGAILRYAVNADISGVELETVGLILLLVGILGLVLSLLYEFIWSDRRARGRDAVVERDRYDVPPRGRY